MTTGQDLNLLYFLSVKRQINTSKMILITSEYANRIFLEGQREGNGSPNKNWIQKVLI